MYIYFLGIFMMILSHQKTNQIEIYPEFFTTMYFTKFSLKLLASSGFTTGSVQNILITGVETNSSEPKWNISLS